MDISRVLTDITTAGVLGLCGSVIRVLRKYKDRLEACEADLTTIFRIPGVADWVEEIRSQDRRINKQKGWLH